MSPDVPSLVSPSLGPAGPVVADGVPSLDVEVDEVEVEGVELDAVAPVVGGLDVEPPGSVVTLGAALVPDETGPVELDVGSVVDGSGDDAPSGDCVEHADVNSADINNADVSSAAVEGSNSSRTCRIRMMMLIHALTRPRDPPPTAIRANTLRNGYS